MDSKIIGYILLTIGLGIIIASCVSVFMIISGRSVPIQVFNLPSISLDFGSLVANEFGTEMAGNIAPRAEIFSKEALNHSLNFFAHIIVMGFFVNVGYKTANIGTGLVRPIKVSLKRDKIFEGTGK